MTLTPDAAWLEESDGLDLSGRAQTVTDLGYSVDDQIHDAVLGLSDEEQFRFLHSYQQEEAAKLVLATAQAKRIAEANSRLEFAASDELDGLRLESVMPLTVWNYWLAKGQADLGGNPWEDEEFMAEFLRDNPECRVKERSQNIVVTNAFDFTNKRKEAA